MKLKKLGNSTTEITTAKGDTILFSYNTPVAANLASGGFIRTGKQWSKTTSKHISQWLDGAKAEVVDQSVLDSLIG